MILFEANYSKKLGLPGYSSHQYSVTVRTELADISQVQNESAKVHAMLQQSVDREIQKTGFLPGNNGNGNDNGHSNGHSNDNGYSNGNGNGHSNGNRQANGNGNLDDWNCSIKQRDLILKIVDENKLEKKQIEALAQERFGQTVKALNKMQASGLIDELLERFGEKKSNGYSNKRYGKGAGK